MSGATKQASEQMIEWPDIDVPIKRNSVLLRLRGRSGCTRGESEVSREDTVAESAVCCEKREACREA